MAANLANSKTINSAHYWSKIENRLMFLEIVKNKLNIKTPSDWGKVTYRQFCESGGGYLLKLYGSLFTCLQSIYKDTNWKKEWFVNLPQVPTSHWSSMENRRDFLDEVAKKLNIKTPSDWGKVKIKHIRKLGGSSLLHNYNGSMFACLQSVYNNVEWKREWFEKLPQSYWNSMENRKKLMDEIAKKLNIKKPSDWGKVTKKKISELGGSTLICNYYKNSILACLQSIYKDIEWKREWFHYLPKSRWNSMENRKKSLNEIARKLNIKNPQDWGNITIQTMFESGARSLLNRYYKNSLFACLQSVYKDVEWKREWFSRISRFPRTHWKSDSNCRQFMDKIAASARIHDTNDWRRITLSVIKHNGGEALLRKHEYSIKSLLQQVYPSNDWSGFFGQKGASAELHLQGLIEKAFPNETVFSNHRKWIF